MSVEADAAAALAEVVTLGSDTPQTRALAEAVANHIVQRELETQTELSAVLEGDVDASGVAREGDILLVGGPHDLTADQAARIRDHLLERLPGVADVIVLGGCTLEGIYRQGSTP